MNHALAVTTRPCGCKAFILLLLAICPAARAAEPWVLLPEPAFMEHKVSQPIAGAKKTVLAPARLTEFGVEFPSLADWKESGASESAVLADTCKQAAVWLAQAEVELVRGPKKVLQYAVLHSDTLPLCAVVFVAEFRTRYEEAFGPKFRIVIPNRHTVFIFPALATNDALYGPKIIAAWKSAAPKVSLEVFECSDGGLRGVGVFEEP